MIIMITGHIVSKDSKWQILLKQYREAVQAIYEFQNQPKSKEESKQAADNDKNAVSVRKKVQADVKKI